MSKQHKFTQDNKLPKTPTPVPVESKPTTDKKDKK